MTETVPSYSTFMGPRYNDGVTDLVASSLRLAKDPEIVFIEGQLAHQKTQ
jgi:hypothetical protein